MPADHSPPRLSESQYDWTAIEHKLAASIRRHLGNCSPEDLRDLAQEGLIRFLRATRRGQVEKPDALAERIGQRVAVDEIRRRQGLPPVSTGVDLGEFPASPADEEYDVTLLMFFVHECLKKHRPRCATLFAEYRKHGNWKKVAECLGLSYEAVRQEWSRGAAQVRKLIAANPDLLPKFLQGFRPSE